MECPNCQAENRENARFCRTCGTRLTPADSLSESAPSASSISVDSQRESDIGRADAPDESVLRDVEDRIERAQAIAQAPTTGIPAEILDEGDTEVKSAPQAVTADIAADSAATIDAVHALDGGGADASSSTAVSQPPAPERPIGEELPEADEAAPPSINLLPPLAPETLVGSRFRIVSLLEALPGENRYAAHDLAACPACSATSTPPDEPYCNECGVELESAGQPPLCELREALSSDAFGAGEEPRITENGRCYLLAVSDVIAAPSGRDKTAVDVTSQAAVSPSRPAALTLLVGYRSHVGMVRELDEDSLCVFTLAGLYESTADPTLGLFIVADGMGGHDGGEVASKLTVQKIAEQLIKRVLLPRFTGKFQDQAGAVQAHLRKAIIDANKEVHDLAQKRANVMGCTLTMAMIVDGAAFIANVGDSRTYIHRQSHLRQITTDHSLVASLVTAGVIQPEEIYTHPERNVIYRSIGAKATVEVDVLAEPLQAGDTLLVCCDGLWEAIRDEGIEDVLLTYPDPQAACVELVRQANLAGGEDNISVIVVKAQEVSASAF